MTTDDVASDWEPLELGVEYSATIDRWRYQHTKQLVPHWVPVKALSRYNISFCTGQIQVYLNYNISPSDQDCADFLLYRINCLKAIELLQGK